MDKNKIEEIVVSQIIKGLEQGDIPRKKTWVSKGQKNFTTQKNYRGFNQMLLSYIASKNNWSNYWVSYKQAMSLGGSLKGAKGTQISYYNSIIKKEKGQEDKTIFFLKYSTVFNLSQATGIEIPAEEEKKVVENEEVSKDIQTYLTKEKIELLAGDPCFSPSGDYIKMPNKNSFENINEYYATFFHEITHSTGHEKRLDRKLQVHNKDEYSKEELVAEMGSAILMNENGLEWNKKNTQAYINGWIKLLKDKPKTIITASNKSFAAVEFYLSKIK